MALKLYERYPQLWESPSNDYPQGAFKNLSAQGETDGSYLEKDWLNDYSGFFGALLRNAEMTPDGTIDTAQRSQFYDALVQVSRDILVEGEGGSTTKAMTQKSVTESFNNIRTDMQLIDAELDKKFDKSDLVNTSGQSTDKVMSQKSVTDFVSESTPIGTVQAYIGETAPNEKWLLCRGQAFSAESYPDLAQLLPDLKIPDLRGVALRGLDANRGFDPSRELLSYQEDAMQKITGKFAFDTGGSTSVYISVAEAIGAFIKGPQDGDSADIDRRGGIGSNVIYFDSSQETRSNPQNETVMKNVAVNFIIKAR